MDPIDVKNVWTALEVQGYRQPKFKGISTKKKKDRVNMVEAHFVNTKISEIPLENIHKFSMDFFFWGKLQQFG